jgi:hypothetical protein
MWGRHFRINMRPRFGASCVCVCIPPAFPLHSPCTFHILKMWTEVHGVSSCVCFRASQVISLRVSCLSLGQQPRILAHLAARLCSGQVRRSWGQKNTKQIPDSNTCIIWAGLRRVVAPSRECMLHGADVSRRANGFPMGTVFFV